MDPSAIWFVLGYVNILCSAEWTNPLFWILNSHNQHEQSLWNLRMSWSPTLFLNSCSSAVIEDISINLIDPKKLSCKGDILTESEGVIDEFVEFLADGYEIDSWIEARSHHRPVVWFIVAFCSLEYIFRTQIILCSWYPWKFCSIVQRAVSPATP